jgi:hypothetical protein
MIEPEQGFAIDDAEYPWGTTPWGIAGMGPLPPSTSYFHRDLDCRAAFGFSTTAVTVSAPAPDRPVLSVSYELAAPWLSGSGGQRWLDPLRTRFGPPDSEERQDLRAYRDPSSGVAHWVRWRRPTIDIGLSIYGGTRTAQRGRSAGIVYVVWGDIAVAAAPYVAAWRTQTEALARSAATIAEFQRFDVPMTLRPAGPPTAPFEAWLALNSRNLLATPVPVRQRLSTQSFALWRAGDGAWALSTLWDTIAPQSAASVIWTEIMPAKGGGHSGLMVGGLSIMAPHGTTSIATAAAALKALPGVTVVEESGYDV